jgi:hypothetical protein
MNTRGVQKFLCLVLSVVMFSVYLTWELLATVQRRKLAYLSPPRIELNNRYMEMTSEPQTYIPIPLNETYTLISQSTTSKRRETLCYNRDLPTGFGDRLSVLIAVSAIAASSFSDVTVFWHEPCVHFINNRNCLHHIQQFVTWPKNLHVMPRDQFSKHMSTCKHILYDTPRVLRSHKAYDGVYTLSWKTFDIQGELSFLNETTYVRNYRQIASQFNIYNVSLPKKPNGPYVALHVRGGDKTTSLSQFITSSVLKEIVGILPILVVTDDVKMTTSILKTIQFKHLIVILPPLPDEYEAMLRDLKVLLDSSFILQHVVDGWSAFSSTAAMMRQIPLLNTWIPKTSDRSERYIGLLKEFDREGACPTELNSANQPSEVRKFIARIRMSVT